MNKQEFLCELEKHLTMLPKSDVNSHILFYSEMIDDIIEDGKTEEEALLQIGSPKQVSAQIIKETPLYKFAKEKIETVAKTKRSALEITLLIVGSPIWISLIASAFAVVLSLYVSLWVVIISLFASVLAFVVSAIGGIVLCVYNFIIGNAWSAIIFISFTLILLGLSIFIFYLAKILLKFALYVIKRIFMGKGE